MSNVSSMDILLGYACCPGDKGLGIYDDDVHLRSGGTLLSRIGSVKKWGERRRGTSSTLSKLIGTFLFIFHLFRAIF